jgi:Spy/CpxP family protein refolding chaperone
MVTTKQIAAAALLVMTFAAGAITGRATSRWGTQDRNRPRTEGRADRQPGNRQGGRGPSGGFVSSMQKELNLSEQQRDSVQAIVKRYDPKMRSVWDAMRPRFDSLRAQVHTEIMTVLTEEQKVNFQKWTAKMDSLARKRERERPKESERAR